MHRGKKFSEDGAVPTDLYWFGKHWGVVHFDLFIFSPGWRGVYIFVSVHIALGIHPF